MSEEEDLRGLVEWLRSWKWPVVKDQLLAAAAERGWDVTSNRPGKGARWNTGLGPEATASVLDGTLAEITIPTSPYFEEGGAGRQERRDTFARQVAAVSEVLGLPADQKPGRTPSAVWALPNGSSLVVEASVSCHWVLTSPEFAEIDRELGPDG